MSRIVAIGASQGGVQALQTLIASLGADFPAPVLIVLHIGSCQSVLPAILTEVDGLVADFGHHREAIQPGRIYVAPPDHHLLVRDGELELSRAPRENWARPAIDPLFRSVAASLGRDAIGIILTGQLNDGTAGLYEIKRRGGIAIVQTPTGAEAPSMPKSALENVAVDYCLPVAEMPKLLNRLVRENSEGRMSGDRKMTAVKEAHAAVPAAFTCPECGGAMREEAVGPLAQYRCHIGHVMTGEVLASAQVAVLENQASSLRRLLNERVSLCENIAEKYRAHGDLDAARAWTAAAREAAERAAIAQDLMDGKWKHPETD